MTILKKQAFGIKDNESKLSATIYYQHVLNPSWYLSFNR